MSAPEAPLTRGADRNRRLRGLLYRKDVSTFLQQVGVDVEPRPHHSKLALAQYGGSLPASDLVGLDDWVLNVNSSRIFVPSTATNQAAKDAWHDDKPLSATIQWRAETPDVANHFVILTVRDFAQILKRLEASK